ncbi:methyltransferase [Leptolyngbya sp. AN03gr2]|uniref:methyltransferase n=1 Tax=unclassified Leptolyngbya TaxID=2650499 RepID=UPI003D32254B
MTATQPTISANAPKVLPHLPPQIAMLQMIGGFRVSRAIYVAAELGIADLLAKSSQTVEELAQATGTHPRSLYRVLRALASLGVFTEAEDSQFHLTPIGEYLRSDVSDGIAATVKLLGESWHWQIWGNLCDSVQTGQAAFDRQYGQNFFDYSEQNPEFGRKHGPSKTSISARASASLVECYDFTNLNQVVDVNLFGGYGNSLIPLLRAHPHLQGVLYDLPCVIESARPAIAQADRTDPTVAIKERIQLVEGHCLDAVPSGGDAYLLMFVLHNWDDLRTIKILQNCYAAMSSTAKLLIVEMMMPKGNDPFVGKFIDLESLLITPGGYERTVSQYQSLLEAAGFRMTRMIATRTANSIIEAVKA